jgi:hypothetical protein
MKLASITAPATWPTENNTRILERLLPPMLWNSTRYISMAERDVLGVKIPTEGRHVMWSKVTEHLYPLLHPACCA